MDAKDTKANKAKPPGFAHGVRVSIIITADDLNCKQLQMKTERHEHFLATESTEEHGKIFI